jgi:hypothetical protein
MNSKTHWIVFFKSEPKPLEDKAEATEKPNCKNCWTPDCQMLGCDMDPCSSYTYPPKEEAEAEN